MRSDYMGVLALGRQQKVGRNEANGGHLEGEFELRELLRHVARVRRRSIDVSVDR